LLLWCLIGPEGFFGVGALCSNIFFCALAQEWCGTGVKVLLCLAWVNSLVLVPYITIEPFFHVISRVLTKGLRSLGILLAGGSWSRLLPSSAVADLGSLL